MKWSTNPEAKVLACRMAEGGVMAEMTDAGLCAALRTFSCGVVYEVAFEAADRIEALAKEVTTLRAALGEADIQIERVEAAMEHYRRSLYIASTQRDEANGDILRLTRERDEQMEACRQVVAGLARVEQERDETEVQRFAAITELARVNDKLDATVAEMNRALAEAEMVGHDADMAEERGFRAGFEAGVAAVDLNDTVTPTPDEAWADYQKGAQ
jgi:hypothetical protein